MIKGLILALQFLTRIPININIEFNDDNIAKSTFFYPLVGAIVGGISALVYWALLSLGKDIASFFAVLMMIVLTGGLHLDGLSDTLDGFLSARDREKTLDIMKDSRIGAFGVIGLVLIILFKFVVISNLSDVPIALILSLANSRLAVIIIAATKRTARPGGLGELLHKNCHKKYIISGAILYIAILSFLNPIYLIPLLVTYVSAEIISYISYKKIDGVTGDIYGAIIEIGEALSLMTFLGVSIWI